MAADRIQKSAEGTGPLYHRLYRVKFTATPAQALAAMGKLQTDPNRFSPQWLASFEKRRGGLAMKAGDEYDVKLSAPWDAPVRVVELGPNFFTLATLEGHLECGKIRFTVESISEEEAQFTIESLARSRGTIVDFVYDKLPIARFAQGKMWECFCDEFAKKAAHKKKDFPVEIVTERKDEVRGKWESI